MNDTNLVNVLQLNISRIIIDGTSGYVKPILKKNSQKAGASSNKYNTCEKIAKFETIFLYGRLG